MHDSDPSPSRPDGPFHSSRSRYWFFGILTGILLISLFTILAFGEYGITLFFALPFAFGFVLSFLTPWPRSASLLGKVGLALAVVAGLSGGLLAAGVEGAICILMAVGLLVLPTFGGVVLGFWVRRLSWRRQVPVFLPVLLLGPATFTYDLHDQTRIEAEVVTRTTIRATPEAVWRTLTHPVRFGPSRHWLLRSGVSHPLSMSLRTTASGAELFCITSNDTTVLPVGLLVANRKLRFSHVDEIVPMRETALYGPLDAPHLHHYFQSDFGQFEIVPLGPDACQLVATTRYSYKITPGFYWQWWTDHLLDAMHRHVLETVRRRTER